MTVSKDEKKIGIALGSHIIKEQYKLSEIVVYLKNRDGRYEIEKLRDFEYHDACITFQFNNKNSNELLFITADELFKLNYLDEGQDRETVYELKESLDDQPNFCVFSKDQRKFMVTSSQDILFVNMDEKNEARKEIDFDQRENISSIQNILATDTHFFVLCNKKEKKLGYYLFSILINDPLKES